MKLLCVILVKILSVDGSREEIASKVEM